MPEEIEIVRVPCAHCAGYSDHTPAAGCKGGRSLGNPHMTAGTIIGYDMGGRPYVWPAEGAGTYADPKAWRP